MKEIIKKIPVAVIGANGYTGVELVRLLLNHPHIRLTHLTSRQYAGKPFAEIFPSFLGKTNLIFEDMDVAKIAKKNRVVFLCLPHHESMNTAQEFRAFGVKVIDLSADFRFKSVDLYEKIYGPHSQKKLLKEAEYGLCELFADNIKKSRLIAVPGCYVTSILLGLAPLVQNQIISLTDIICDAKSGVSGAGRQSAVDFSFAEVNENFKAYALTGHRHRHEIEEKLQLLSTQSVRVTFTPHLLPITRGILSTIYTKPLRQWQTPKLEDIYEKFYKKSPFVKILKNGAAPKISSVAGTNFCHISVHYDQHSERLIVLSAIDNLIKGASGQAIQCFNIMFDLPQTTGLHALAVYP